MRNIRRKEKEKEREGKGKRRKRGLKASNSLQQRPIANSEW
jgi:hypothetical protein